MRIRKIRRGAALIALTASGAAAVIMYLTTWAWLYSCFAALFIFLLTFLVAAAVMRIFVKNNIRPMYRFLHSKHGEREHEGGGRTVPEPGIEDLRDLAENSRQEIARLKENEKYRKEYIGNVSHEMKTPIFNIQGYISTLLDGALEDEAINRKYLERAEKSIDRLINIVTDLDEISKLESGVLVLHKEKFDVVALARDAVEAVEMDAARKNIRFSIKSDGAAPLQPMHVYADKHYVTQIFVNLLTNSIRYGNLDGSTVITFTELYDKVLVEVTDNGVGISKDDIPRVFERFYRTDKSRSREEGGTGLGLSIVKHIVEAHNESIALRSRLGKGSTFSFSLSKI